MQKIYKIITLVAVYLIAITNVKAGWEEVQTCPEGSTELTLFLDSNMQGIESMNKSTRDKYCISTHILSSQIALINSSSISICQDGERVMRDNSTTFCCPSNATHIGYHIEYHIGFAPYLRCLDSNDNAVGRDFPNPTSYKLGKSEYFPQKTGEDYSKCNGCYVKNGVLQSSTTSIKNSTKTAGDECIDEGSPYESIDGKTMICRNGKGITTDQQQNLLDDEKAFSNLPGLFEACYEYSRDEDIDEYNACIKCYEKCRDKESCPLIYNSLGCIDTNPNGLITRIFQIGIGLMGGLGLFRLMQAAILRQTNDPSKIKEASEMFTSVIVGGVLLIFGVIILRFIGINVLQIMPSDFLSFGDTETNTTVEGK